MMRVTGYHKGISYTVECDPSRKSEDPDIGVMTHASPTSIRSLVGGVVGEHHAITEGSASVKVSFGSCEGILAALVALTEITAIVGDDTPSAFSGGSATRSLGTNPAPTT